MATIETIDVSRAPRKGTRRVLGMPIGLISPIVLLGLWEIAARTGAINVTFFPAPSTILATGFAQAQTAQFWGDLGISLQRIAVGLVMGAVPGVLVGLAMGLFRPVREALNPLIAALFPIPKIALLPLLLLIFGIGETSKYVTIAINVFFLMTINTFAGVVSTPKIYFEVAQNLKASRLKTYLTVALPGALPGIFTGLRICMGTALILLVAVEFSTADSGVGYRIWWAWTVFWVDTMYVGFLVIAILGLGFSYAVDFLERLVIPWHRKHER
ncbi:ABC transporter permease [Maritimibacter dapengensis]|uniref:ABC transporter permease n=1 Tax=Maritimibacter dapengensis TaxID=2836868 RepID=A0ABS6T3R8_9RHOB|nr:ABC transporter permease [Maritimibacter dapengensis]MBV7379900.1 ABC transporter permease [Maritimibacter dapengensis]